MCADGSALCRPDMRDMRLRVAFLSAQTEVTDVVSRICGWLIRHGVAPDIRQDVELALAEALNNVVEHAYRYREDGVIEITVIVSAETVTMEITDAGRRFDGPPPLRAFEIESIGSDDPPEGGFGWNLIRTLTDDVAFHHRDGKNCLTLAWRLSPLL